MNLETTSKEAKLEIAVVLALPERVNHLLNEGIQASPSVYELISDNFTPEANAIRSDFFQRHLVPSERSLSDSLSAKAPMETILSLVNAGAPITGSVLANAIEYNIDAAHVLLKKENATPTTQTLLWALKCGQINIACELVQAGIQPTAEMFNHSTIRGMEFLLDQGVQPSEDYVKFLVGGYQTEILSFMVQHGVQLMETMIPLIKFPAIAEIFLDAGFQIPETDISLDKAIISGSIKLIKHFIDSGAQLRSFHLWLADCDEVRDLLVQAGVTPD